MANFLDTTKEYIVKDISNTNNTYWVQAKAEITITTAGKVSWKLTMTNDYEEHSGRGKGRATLLYFRIGDTKVICNSSGSSKYYSYEDSTDSRWKTFPTGHNSSASGSFTLPDISSSEIEVVLRVACMTSDIDSSTKEVFTFERDYWTSVKAGKAHITDNHNNTFSISWEDAIPGRNNEVVEQKCFYQIGTNALVEVRNQNSIINLPAGISQGTSYVQVSAYTAAIGEIITEEILSATQVAHIAHYCAPCNAPTVVGKPFITPLADNRVNLTAKHPWLFWFPVGEWTNKVSPIAGYRLQLKVDNNSAYFSGTVKENTPINTILNASGTAYYCDVTDDSLDGVYMEAPDPYKEWIWHYILIDPTTIKVNDQPLKGGMNVVMQVKPYAKNGVGSKLLAENYMMTAETLVHGSGTVRVKKDGNTDSWDECQVWIKLEDNTDSWIEADGIHVKVADGTDEWAEVQ